MAKRSSKGKDVGSTGRTAAGLKNARPAKASPRSADADNEKIHKKAASATIVNDGKRTVIDGDTIGPHGKVNLEPIVLEGKSPDGERPSRKPRTKKYTHETIEEFNRRQAQYVAKSRERQKIQEAIALGYESPEEYKRDRRRKKQEQLDRVAIENSAKRGAYSKLTLVRKALVSLAEALNAEFNKPLAERGDFREISFRIQHLANIKEIL